MYPEAEVVHQGVPPMLDARCAVRVNGQSTAWFPVQRGVKQGDPISGILSVLVLNVLAIQLESSPSLGVHCYRENRATAQFADDLNVMVVGNENVNRALTIIESFGRFSGCKINVQKSMIYPMSCLEISWCIVKKWRKLLSR